ncbi:hypothetical protein ACIO3O_01515 [Streptomyces sp. NPDC087440]|uniref:hypothetical protein n=1 Tax=Streptomyces sp. NPDC087440 TaxID=3365790 RepID=UPI003821CC43
MVDAQPDFPEVGDLVALVYDSRATGVVERQEALPKGYFPLTAYALSALSFTGGYLLIWG